MTSVSSSRPRCFRSLTRAADGWSVSWHWLRICVGQVAVLVPAHVIKLDEPHAALGQAAGQQAVGGVAAGLLNVGAVEVEDRLRLVREVGQLGNRRLHAIAQLVLGDPGDDLGVAGLGVVQVVERGDVVEHLPPRRPRAAGRVGEIEHRLLAAAQLHALVARGQEAASPQAVVKRLVGPPAREQDDEGRQVLVLAPQAVGDPRPHARPARELRAGLHERDRRVVVDRLGLHRADQADVVGDRGRVRQAARSARRRFARAGRT